MLPPGARTLAVEAGDAPRGLADWLLLLWPFPAVLGSTYLIAWASEVASFFISRGMALAVLALLQVLPEFAVEAVLARNAGLDPAQLTYVTANFTGANRILVGLALPLIFLITYRVRKRQGTWRGALTIERDNSVEVVFLLLPSLWSVRFWFTHAITLLDTGVLFAMYAGYLLVLYRLPVAGAEEAEDLHGVPARVMRRGRRFQAGFAAGSFLLGGLILLFTVEPFVRNMQVVALALGISAYLVVQYVAPLLSEFPEFLSTTYFARMGKGEDAFTNVVSAKINQWTLLVGMIPVVFALSTVSAGRGTASLPLDAHQNIEVLLTTAQGLFAVVCLFKMRMLLWEAAALLFLWAFQAIDFVTDPLFDPFLPRLLNTPSPVREWTTIAFLALIVVEALRYRKAWSVFRAFAGVWREHVGRPARGG